MKNVNTWTVREIKVEINSVARKDWARIRDAKTHAILHTGQLGYIRKVAKYKYNKYLAV